MADASIGSAYLQVIPKMDEGALKSSMASAGKSGSQQFGQFCRHGAHSLLYGVFQYTTFFRFWEEVFSDYSLLFSENVVK